VVLALKATVASVTQEAAERVAAVQAEADARILALAAKADVVALGAHADALNNPHAVSKSQVGLPNAENTADALKPVSTAQQAALDAKAATTDARLSDTRRPRFVGNPSSAETVPFRSIALGDPDYLGLISGRPIITEMIYPLEPGRTYTTIGALMQAGASGMTGHWFFIWDPATQEVLRSTVNNTDVSWAGSTNRVLSLSSPYTPITARELALGCCVVATTPGRLHGQNLHPNIGSSARTYNPTRLAAPGWATPAPNGTAMVANPFQGLPYIFMD
jgi:hypothetical protein